MSYIDTLGDAPSSLSCRDKRAFSENEKLSADVTGNAVCVRRVGATAVFTLDCNGGHMAGCDPLPSICLTFKKFYPVIDIVQQYVQLADGKL